MRHVRFLLVFFFTICTTLPALSIAEMEQGWIFLFDNKIEEAREVFENYLSNPEPPEEARLGAVLCDWAQGDYPAMTESLGTLIENHPNSPYLPGYLALTEINDLQAWDPKERIDSLQSALDRVSSLPARQALLNRLAKLQSMRLMDETKATAKEAGVVLDHWNVVGPFGKHGSPDIFHPFGPEHVIQQTYDGWLEEVSFQPLDEIHHNGWIEFDGLIYPRAGIAYAVNVIESTEAQRYNLIVESNADLRVWLNGEPLFEKCKLKHDYHKAVTRGITLKQGKNVLVVKTASDGKWDLRVRLQTMDDTIPNWKSVPFSVSEMARHYLQHFESKDSFANADQEEYPFFKKSSEENNPYQPVWKNVLLAVWHHERDAFEKALTAIQDADTGARNFALLHSLKGEIHLAQASARPASKTRFQQLAESSFKQALELNPTSNDALAGLVSYYFDRDQIDPALELLNEHKENHGGSHNNLIDYSYALLYARKGFEHESVRLMEKARLNLLPSIQLPQRLYEYYLRNGHLEKAQDIAKEALERIPGYLPYINLAVRLSDHVEDTTEIETVIQKAVDAFPQHLEFPLALGRLYEQTGRLKKAQSIYQQLRFDFPDHPQPLNRLADVNTLIENQIDTETYQALYDAHPGSSKAVRVLRDAADKDFPYQEYDVHLDDIDIKVADRWENTRASSIYLIDMMVLVLHENGTYDQYIHQAIKILNQEGVQDWAEVVIPQAGETEIIFGRTINPDGTEWAISHRQDLGGQQSLSMYGVEEGSIVEYAYLQRSGLLDPGSNVYSGGYFFGTENDHMLLSKLTVLRHKDVPFHVDVNGELRSTVTEKGDWIVYDWEKWMSDGIKPERFAPTLSKRVPALQMSTGSDWMPFAERMRATVYPFEERSNLIAAKAEEIAKGVELNDAKVERIYHWIQETIEDSSGGQTTVDTFTLQAGNRYQKIRLANQMIRSLGIQTKLAAALENDERDGYRPLPFPNYPSTSVLIVPEQDGIHERIVIDFSSRFAPFNQINPALRKHVALVLDEHTPYFEPLDPEWWEHGLLMRQAWLEMSIDAAAITGRYTYDHGYDEQIRQALTNPEVKQRLADAQIANDLRGVQVSEYDILNVDDISKPPVLSFSGKLPGAVIKTGENEYQFKPVLMKVDASGLVSDTTRESPVTFNGSPKYEPVELAFDMTSILSKGARIVLPENSFIISEFGYYSLFYAWDGKVLKVRRSFLIPDQTIAPEDYQRFVEFCREIDQIEDRTVRIRSIPKAG